MPALQCSTETFGNRFAVDSDPPTEKPPLKDRLSTLLLPFHFTDILGLRRLMVDTGGVISGSMALAILYPREFIPNDIDFYVLPSGFPAVLEYVQQYGYIITPYEHIARIYDTKNAVVVKLVHPVSLKSINVVTAVEDHVVTIITHFHSTLVMNYVAWYGLVVLYPEWTLKKSGLVVTDTLTTRKCFSKYIECGFNLHRDSQDLVDPLEAHICRKDPYCSVTTRSLQDGHSHVDAFNPMDFDLVTDEVNMIWTLPVPCFCNNEVPFEET